MKKIFALLLVLAIALCFCACENDNDEEISTNAPATTVDPKGINFGYNEEKNEYDRWYLQETDDVIYAYLSFDEEVNADNYACTFTLIKSGVEAVREELYFSDDHLITLTNSKTSLDIVFEDNFNLYDYVSDSYYSRGSKDEYDSYFADRVYVQEDELNSITFSSDFTCKKSDNEKETQGTWEVTSKRTLECIFDGEKIIYSIKLNDDFIVQSIENGDEIYYNVVSEDETVNKYKVY